MKNKEFYKKYGKLDQEEIDMEFIEACEHGYLDTVQYLMNSHDLKIHPSIKNGQKPGLTEACSNGHLQVVRYLLNYCGLKFDVNIQEIKNYGLKCACEEGQLEIVQYLLTSVELKKHANIHAKNDQCFLEACRNNRVEVVRYLLTSPELKEHSNIDAKNDTNFTGIMLAFLFERLELIHFFIFEFNIEKTENIKNILKDYPNLEIEKLFNIRDFNQSLTDNLVYEESKVKNKIKL